MRAIGKGSLSSILAVGLHVTRIILFVAFVGLTIAMIVMPIASGFDVERPLNGATISTSPFISSPSR